MPRHSLCTDRSRRVLRGEAARERSSNTAKIFESRTALSRRLARYREIQAIYMPSAPRLLAAMSEEIDDGKSPVQLAEHAPLLLPSEVLSVERDDGTVGDMDARNTRRQVLVAGFAVGLVDAEMRLRRAQCHSALDDLRTKLAMRTRYRQYKRVNVRHQAPNIKANEALANIERRIHKAAAKYRAAREALRSLVETHAVWIAEYDRQYPPLKDEDVRALDADDPAPGNTSDSLCCRNNA